MSANGLGNGSDGNWTGQIDCALGWVVVADGMGGHDAGEAASQSVIRSIIGLAREARSELDVARMLETVNERIFHEMYDGHGRPAMGSTVVGVIFRDQQAIDFQYRRQPCVCGRWRRVETGKHRRYDHSDDRKPPDQDSRADPIARRELQPPSHYAARQVHHAQKQAGLVLCSDGLTDMLSDEEIAANLARRQPEPAQSLVSAALDAGGSDNITVVVVGAAFS